MKILVINCGSSSLKYQLFDMDQEKCLARGGVERVGSPDAFMTHRRVGNDKVKRDVDAPDHERGLKYVFDALVDPEIGVINSQVKQDRAKPITHHSPPQKSCHTDISTECFKVLPHTEQRGQI